MENIAYNIAVTNDKLTSRKGLLLLGKVLRRLRISKQANQLFRQPGSNRGYSPGTYLNSFLLMLINGGSCLEDVRHLHKEKQLLKVMGMNDVPSADALGNFLRSHQDEGLSHLRRINRAVLGATLHNTRRVTLDIDATFIRSYHKHAKTSYLKQRGYMPMVGHIAETGQVVSFEMREGNVAPASGNLEFIKDCMDALPDGVKVQHCRIDAAGYQVRVIDLLERNDVGYAIRAKMCGDIKSYIKEADRRGLWQPLVDRDGVESEDKSVCHTLHTMNDLDHAFELVIQRQPRKKPKVIETDDEAVRMVQAEVPLGLAVYEEHLESEHYVYRAIATNRITKDKMTASQVVDWYNRRGEHSENRIKELKNHFAGKHLPCQQFGANALFFGLVALAYNAFVLFRFALPKCYEYATVETIRREIFDMAGKIVHHARSITVKMSRTCYEAFHEAVECIDLCLPEPAT